MAISSRWITTHTRRKAGSTAVTAILSPSTKKKVIKFEIKNQNEDDVKKEDNRNSNVLYKSMKVSGMAKKLEEVLNRPKTFVNDTEKKEETPIVHETVNLKEGNTGNYTISYGGGSRRKRAQKKFQDI